MDHPSIGVLVWILMVAAAALAVAGILAWAPGRMRATARLLAGRQRTPGV